MPADSEAFRLHSSNYSCSLFLMYMHNMEVFSLCFQFLIGILILKWDQKLQHIKEGMDI